MGRRSRKGRKDDDSVEIHVEDYSRDEHLYMESEEEGKSLLVSGLSTGAEKDGKYITRKR